METTSILWIQKISFVQFCPAYVGFVGFAQPGFNF